MEFDAISINKKAAAVGIYDFDISYIYRSFRSVSTQKTRGCQGMESKARSIFPNIETSILWRINFFDISIYQFFRYDTQHYQHYCCGCEGGPKRSSHLRTEWCYIYYSGTIPVIFFCFFSFFGGRLLSLQLRQQHQIANSNSNSSKRLVENSNNLIPASKQRQQKKNRSSSSSSSSSLLIVLQ